jgi:hypothetical protein
VVARLEADDLAVTDREFTVALLLAAGVQAWVTRLRKNFTARRATPPAYRGRGRRPIYGELVRPLARRRGQRDLPATPPDQESRWTEAGRDLHAAQWHALVLPDAAPGSPTFTVTATYDPAYTPRALPRPLAGRATPARGQTDVGRGAPVRACQGNLSALPRAVADRWGGPDLRGGDQPGRADRCLGPAATPDARTAAPGAGTSHFPTRVPLARATSGEKGGHGPLAQRILGPTTPCRAHFHHFGHFWPGVTNRPGGLR